MKTLGILKNFDLDRMEITIEVYPDEDTVETLLSNMNSNYLPIDLNIKTQDSSEMTHQQRKRWFQIVDKLLEKHNLAKNKENVVALHEFLKRNYLKREPIVIENEPFYPTPSLKRGAGVTDDSIAEAIKDIESYYNEQGVFL